LFQPQLIVSSPIPPTPSTGTTVSNGAAPSIFLDVDGGLSTPVVDGSAPQVRAGELLQRSVSDGAEATTSNTPLSKMTSTKSAGNLTNELSPLDVAKL